MIEILDVCGVMVLVKLIILECIEVNFKFVDLSEEEFKVFNDYFDEFMKKG